MPTSLDFTTKNTMGYLRIITTKTSTPEVEGSIAIDNDIQGDPILEYLEDGEWVPLDNQNTIKRMARLDDLYNHLYLRNWGIGPRYSMRNGKLYIHTRLYDPIPELSGGISISENVTQEDLDKLNDMNKEIDIYYNYLESTWDLLEGSAVVDLWEYPTEYGGTLSLENMMTPQILKATIGWIYRSTRKTETVTFSPKDGDFQRTLGDSEVIFEFISGKIRVFPGRIEVTECIIHHCSAIYEKL